ncbi:uncharacterized protein P174DRAFT_273559 [Aspergillus novofumigatus IBT 16806]|uniref:Uncharacterized protein n=1 Tax=Aspergillus novofumigatus (strain IBT 16806) TaxID=1392255 RepID=A0A2I1BZK3_ASPN1|nr:uncharacterized protein P174DRAFT_273559 [Aspergillus novofumigatus IBT 16806]PKX90795.1 hypothetical protein P174DRAFT_273559 [Aspergillus novofumigatus IBT 16806]
MMQWQDNSQVQVRESLVYLIFYGGGYPSMTCSTTLFIKILYRSNNKYIPTAPQRHGTQHLDNQGLTGSRAIQAFSSFCLPANHYHPSITSSTTVV